MTISLNRERHHQEDKNPPTKKTVHDLVRVGSDGPCSKASNVGPATVRFFRGSNRRCESWSPQLVHGFFGGGALLGEWEFYDAFAGGLVVSLETRDVCFQFQNGMCLRRYIDTVDGMLMEKTKKSSKAVGM